MLVPLLYFVSYQIGRGRGKSIEQNLWRKWNGPPTTRFLRHSDKEFGNDSKKAVHIKLRALGLDIPDEAEEQRNPEDADARYRYATLEIIRRTRNPDDFPLVFRSLTSYGLQRNLYGLKWVGIGLVAVSMLATIAVAKLAAVPVEELGPLIVSLIVNLGLFLAWTLAVREEKVRLAADDYARSLLEAALNLEVN